MKKYKALAFDFDGTLFDTHEINFQAYQKAYHDLGVEITHEQFEKTRGMSVFEFNAILGVHCDIDRLRQLKAYYYAQNVLKSKPNLYLINVLKQARLDGIKTAIVTTARMQNIVPLLYEYRIWGYVDVFVTQEDVNGYYKPDSRCYKIACERLMMEPKDILAFEDEEVGLAAARRIGIDTIRISKFYDDYFAEAVGGSDARTLLIWDFNEKVPVVRKIAKDATASEKLKQQYDWLKENKCYSIVEAYDCGTIKGNFYYDMEYIHGWELYKHPQRATLFLPALSAVIRISAGSKHVNEIDVRRDLYDMYIVKGVEIYNRVTGENRKIPFEYYKDIPQWVNDFRRGRCHGDTTLENIMLENETNRIVFIDPVPLNVVSGPVHDLSKILQSLYGYETIRDKGICPPETFAEERGIFEKEVRQYLMESEYKSLKFLTAVLYFRRLRYQERQNPDLVKVYGDIAFKLMEEFKQENYTIAIQ